MVKSARPFLMFEGRAEEAMEFYARQIAGADYAINARHPAGPAAGKVMSGAVRIAGLEIMCFDSPAPHAFSFTPAFSIFLDCDSEAELDRLAAAFSEGGKFLMPPDNYGFSRKFCWAEDRFGVSWQMTVA